MAQHVAGMTPTTRRVCRLYQHCDSGPSRHDPGKGPNLRRCHVFCRFRNGLCRVSRGVDFSKNIGRLLRNRRYHGVVNFWGFGGLILVKAFSRGMTLIEMAIVLVVIGLVVGGGLSIVGPIRNAERTASTNQNMDVIEKALVAYVIQNGCLPCPADGSLVSTNGNAGRPLDNSGSPYTGCAATACWAATAANVPNAVIPWKALGLGERQASDAWGNRLRYRVGGTATSYNSSTGNCDTTSTDVTESNGMVRDGTSCYPTGNLIIDTFDDDSSNDIANTFDEAVYVVISSGPDRSMALQATTGGSATSNVFGQQDTDAQYLNAGQNSTLLTTVVQGDVDDGNSRNHFDDIVRFKNAPLIIQLCGKNACGNPA